MPLAFSFFSSPTPPVYPPEAPVVGASSSILKDVSHEPFTGTLDAIPTSPFPVNMHSLKSAESEHASKPAEADREVIPTVILPSFDVQPDSGVVFPERRGNPKGLAALVVRQSGVEAPPLNKRQFSPLSPFPQASSPLPQEILAKEAPTSCPPQLPLAAPTSSLEESDMEAFRQELHGEIEQVKNDLFGAVMGVSALKDRLDGLEAQLSRAESAPAAPVSAPPSGLDIEPIITSWLDDHLPAAVERMLAEAQVKMLGTPGAAFFRSSLPLSEAERQSLFSQPPVILNSTPV